MCRGQSDTRLHRKQLIFCLCSFEALGSSHFLSSSSTYRTSFPSSLNHIYIFLTPLLFTTDTRMHIILSTALRYVPKLKPTQTLQPITHIPNISIQKTFQCIQTLALIHSTFNYFPNFILHTTNITYNTLKPRKFHPHKNSIYVYTILKQIQIQEHIYVTSMHYHIYLSGISRAFTFFHLPVVFFTSSCRITETC